MPRDSEAADQNVQELAHDLRNLLTCIRGYGEDSLRRDLLPLQRHAQLLRLIALVDRCALLVGALQGSAADSGEVSVAEDVADFAIEAHQPLFRAKGIRLERRGDTGPTFVAAGAQTTLRILHNLLANALKFTPKGGAVTVNIEAAPLSCRIEVEDTGSGMTAEQLERAFQPFYQGAPSEPHSRGLGLAIAKGLAVGAGGAIEARSEGPGLGAAVSVRLPLYSCSLGSRGIGVPTRCASAHA
ncbi:MAG: HAMP domain-containing histidine kinase [Elusimicrobia bacterium]|nr:HAMP domain-containing histidine kinase [Elusimicrobiota bacterium]